MSATNNYVDKVSFRWLMGLLIFIMSTAVVYSYATRSVVDVKLLEVTKSLNDYGVCLTRDYATKKEFTEHKALGETQNLDMRRDMNLIKYYMQELCIKNGIPVDKESLSGKR